MNRSSISLTLAAVMLLGATGSFAQSITANPGDDLQKKLNGAANGTLLLGAGTFTVNGPLIVHAGTTIQGAANLASHVVFNLSGQNLYGFVVDANASNVTITGLDIQSSSGVLQLSGGNHYKSVHFIANNVQYGGGKLANGNYVFGIYGSIGCDDLQISWNYFHDSPNSVRNWEVWGVTNGHLDHNLFYNIDDGGHLVAASNTTFSYNYGHQFIRMGQEIQDFGSVGQNLTFDHNVFYDHFNAFNDSEGLSVCPQATSGVVVSNNWIENNLAPGASFGTMIDGAAGGPNRFGYGIEMICPGSVLENNTIILSLLSADASAVGETTAINSNVVYGGSNTVWGVWATEPGPTSAKAVYTLGTGTLANTVNAGLGGAPSPPANTFAGPAIYAATSNGTLWTPTWSPAASAAPQQSSLPSSPTLAHTIQVMSDGSVNVN